MHSRRLVAMLLGLWLAGTLFSAFIATSNFRVADQILETPPIEARTTFESIGSDSLRQLLRHQASEANRHLFQFWGHVDTVLVVAIGAILLFTRGSKPAVILTMVSLLGALAATFLLVPEMISVGRGLDFSSADPGLPERASFGKLHGMYGGLAVLRLLMMTGVAGIVLYRSNRKRTKAAVLNKVNAIDDPDNGHVDR